MLITQRADDGHWCFPGGAIDSGETVANACEREVLEETGLTVRVTKLIGIYSNRDRVYEYPDGNRWQIIDLFFEVTVTGGELRIGPEVVAANYCTIDEIARLKLHDIDRERLADLIASPKDVILR